MFSALATHLNGRYDTVRGSICYTALLYNTVDNMLYSTADILVIVYAHINLLILVLTSEALVSELTMPCNKPTCSYLSGCIHV